MNTGRRNRIAMVSVVAGVTLLLAGCGPKASGPTSSGTTKPMSSAAAAPAAGGTTDLGMAIQGETAIGPLGDPCSLTVADVEAASGYKVTEIKRGAITSSTSGPSQNCVYLTSGPALVGPLASALGAMAGLDPTAVTNAVNAAGGIVGITLMTADKSTGTAAPADSGVPSTEPGVTVKKLTDLGPYAAVVALPSGAAGFAEKGTTVVALMVLIGGTINPAGTEQMLRASYAKVK
jgi:hypothetical protein